MMVTCMQRKAKIESNSPPQEQHVDHLHEKKKAKFKSNSIQKIMMVTCMQKRVKIKSSSITCKQKWWKIKYLQDSMVVT